MIINMNHFNLTADAIDHEAIECAPCEGIIIPINIDNVDGLQRYLRKKVEKVYIYIPEAGIEDAMFCIKYATQTHCIVHAPQFKLDQEELALVCEAVSVAN